MLEGLGFTYNNQTPVQIVDASKHFNSKISKFRESFSILEEERIRKKELDREKQLLESRLKQKQGSKENRFPRPMP